MAAYFHSLPADKRAQFLIDTYRLRLAADDEDGVPRFFEDSLNSTRTVELTALHFAAFCHLCNHQAGLFPATEIEAARLMSEAAEPLLGHRSRHDATAKWDRRAVAAMEAVATAVYGHSVEDGDCPEEIDDFFFDLEAVGFSNLVAPWTEKKVAGPQVQAVMQKRGWNDGGFFRGIGGQHWAKFERQLVAVMRRDDLSSGENSCVIMEDDGAGSDSSWDANTRRHQ